MTAASTKEFNVIFDWLHNTIKNYGCVRTADSMYCRTDVANINTLFNNIKTIHFLHTHPFF